MLEVRYRLTDLNNDEEIDFITSTKLDDLIKELLQNGFDIENDISITAVLIGMEECQPPQI